MFEESEEIEKSSFDNFFLGLFVSFLMTFACLVLFSGTSHLMDDLDAMVHAILNKSNFVNLLIASLMPSMFLFFFFYKTERWQSAKGLIVAVFLSMILVAVN